MRQNRWELGGEYRFEESYFDKLRVRSAQSRYRHDEVEAGSVGTVFSNHGNESRLELMRSRGPWQSVSGVQSQLYRFTANGEEAYLPTSQNQIVGLFNFNELRFNESTLSFGVRAESYEIERERSTSFGEHSERSFFGANGSVGLQQRRRHFTYGLTYSYTERAPTFQELFADGAHLATGLYETGEQALGKEKVHGLEASLSHENGKGKGRFSVYAQRFHDYIALNPTGDTDSDSGFAISQYDAVEAQFYGFDVDYRYQLLPSIDLLWKADWVRGKDLSNGQNIARLSPGRTTLAIEYAQDSWLADVEVQQVFYQSKVADNEATTDGYQLINLGFSHDFNWDENRLNAFVRAKNLFNREARQHVSPLKERAPLVGRNFVAGMQLIF